ncbi:MAG: hypothetical protein WAN86_27290, partial [Hyphomicrobiaceae bacterium]
CDHCGFDFQPPAINIGGGRITLSNNITNCPRCGGVARFVDGTFQVENGKFRILFASTVTREMLTRLQLLVEEADRDPTQLDNLRAKAEAIHSGFGALFTPANWSPEVKAAVIAAMTAFAVTKCSPSPTVEVAPRIIIEMPTREKTEPPSGVHARTPLPIKFSK